jgi:cytochrome c553
MRARLAVWVASALVLAACGAAPAAPGDVERGRQLFAAPVASPRGDQQACVRCHALAPGEKSATGLGTNFSGIGLRAGETVPGQSAELYLRTSIVDPDAHLAGGFQDGLMYREYAKVLSEQQINDLVAFMLTLRRP